MEFRGGQQGDVFSTKTNVDCRASDDKTYRYNLIHGLPEFFKAVAANCIQQIEKDKSKRTRRESKRLVSPLKIK
jgi:hypothetical protein